MFILVRSAAPSTSVRVPNQSVKFMLLRDSFHWWDGPTLITANRRFPVAGGAQPGASGGGTGPATRGGLRAAVRGGVVTATWAGPDALRRAAAQPSGGAAGGPLLDAARGNSAAAMVYPPQESHPVAAPSCGRHPHLPLARLPRRCPRCSVIPIAANQWGGIGICQTKGWWGSV